VSGLSSDDWVLETLRDQGVRFRLLTCRPSDGGRRRLVRLMEVDGTGEALSGAMRRLRVRLGSRDVTTTDLGPERQLLRVASPLPPTCAAAFDLGDFCLSCPFLDEPPGGTRTNWSVLVPRIGDARRLLAAAGHRGEGRPGLVRAGALRRPGTLTSRQERALHVAFQLGYFDYPRKAGLSAVAARLGVGRSSALELLRKGMTKLAAQRFLSEPPTKRAL